MGKPGQPWFVLGHRNPDADAICSAIGHAAFLHAIGEAEPQAARCGEIPLRVQRVLEKAGLPEPVLVQDLRPTAGSICRQNIVHVKATDTFWSAYRRMVEHSVRSVPVLNEDDEVMGLLRFLDLLKLLLPPATEGLAMRGLNASLLNIAATLGSPPLTNPEACKEEEGLIMMVGASSQDTVELRLSKARDEGTVGRYLVICGDRPVVHRHAVHFGVRGLIITGGYKIDPALERKANETGTVIIKADHDTATTVKLSLCARRVSHVLSKEFHSLPKSETLGKLRKAVASVNQDLFPVTENDSQKIVGVLSKSDLVDPPRTRLSLVDHNEFSQAVRGVEEAKVVEILDHHRLSGDFTSSQPVRFLNEPVGSTSTIVGNRFRIEGLTPDPGVAVCLCAGIISDTLNLTSPTSTEMDAEILAWLAGIAKIEPKEFAEDFFASGSLLIHGDAESIIQTDRKEFSENGAVVSLSQVEELSLEPLQGRTEELLQNLRALRETRSLSLAALLVTNVREHNSVLLACGEEKALRALEYQELRPNVYDAPGVVSRKKQLFPAIAKAVQVL